MTARALVRSSLRAHRRDVITGALLGSVHQICEALVAIVIGLTIDHAVLPGDVGAMVVWAGALCAVFVVLALSAAVGYYLMGRAAQRIAHDLRVRIAARVVDARGGTKDLGRTGEVLSLATSDAERVGEAAELIGGAATAVAVLLGGSLYLLAVSWQLGLLILVGLPIMLGTARRLAEPLGRRSTAEQEAVAGASGIATDLVTGLRVLKGLGAEPAASRRYRGVSRSARDRHIHAARYTGLYESLTLAISGLLVVLITWFGGRLALHGTITIGQLVAAVGLAQFLVSPLQGVTGISAHLAVVRASAQRIADFIAAAPAVADGDARLPPAGPRRVALSGVRSGTLRGVDLTVQPGEWIGVVAASERDALSLLDVLARRCDPAAGVAAYGDVDLRLMSLDDLRATLVVADHDAVLFDGTVRDNIAAAAAPAIDVAAVAAATAADEVMAALPHGALSNVGENGQALSGGQRQRVTLARAVASGAPVLVLHDPTTAVDAATEARIAGALRSFRTGRTTILVTTSPALLSVCDRVVVVRAGVVVASDDHANLVRNDGLYRDAVLT